MTQQPAQVCQQCPWLKANQGRRTPAGIYTQKALMVLWNALRRGATQHVCPTHTADRSQDTDHPHLVQVECPAAIALIYREIAKLNHTAAPGTRVTNTHIQEYIDQNPTGLTRAGITHWTTIRPRLPPQLGGNPVPPVHLSLVRNHNLISKPEP